MLLALTLVATMAGLRLAAALVPVRHSPRRRIDDTSLPCITVLVPLHDEAGIVDDLLSSLDRLDYPKDRLDLRLIVEAEDHATLEAARKAARHHRLTLMVVPPVGPQTKPKALNYALQAARGSLIAVYDAEDVPHPGQLRAAAEAFAADPALACVQAPLGWYNASDNWLTRQFALEYAAQFHAIIPLLGRLGWPIPLGGTSNVLRRSALIACGGWDPFNVTEDADLGFRLVRHGLRIGTIAPPTAEECPITYAAWTAQRSRWLKGHLATWLVQMRNPRGLIARGGVQAWIALQLTLGCNVLCALGHAPSVMATLMFGLLAPAAGLSQAALLPLLTLFGGYSAAMICASVAARRARLSLHLRDLATMPVYWLLQTGAMVRALHELATRPYFWAKTRHGVSTAGRDKASWGSDLR